MKGEEKEFYRCPLCAYTFGEETYVCQGCPLGKACKRLCCPRCHYPLVKESQTVRFLKRVLDAMKA